MWFQQDNDNNKPSGLAAAEAFGMPFVRCFIPIFSMECGTSVFISPVEDFFVWIRFCSAAGSIPHHTTPPIVSCRVLSSCFKNITRRRPCETCYYCRTTCCALACSTPTDSYNNRARSCCRNNCLFRTSAKHQNLTVTHVKNKHSTIYLLSMSQKRCMVTIHHIQSEHLNAFFYVTFLNI